MGGAAAAGLTRAAGAGVVRWYGGGTLAVVGVVLMVMAFTEPTGRRSYPWWWRWGVRLVWLAVGGGLVAAGAVVAGHSRT